MSNQQQLWDRVLAEWPVDRIQNMTLEEYVSVGDKTTFTYWLETEARLLGSIKGGSSEKFGIYKRSNPSNNNNRNNYQHDNTYTWHTKYGDNAQAAFVSMRQHIVDVITAVKAGDLDAIDAMDIALTLKWKVAFIYQDRSNPKVLNIYKDSVLRRAVQDNKATMGQAYTRLIANMPDDAPLFEYASNIWNTNQAASDDEINQLVEKMAMDAANNLSTAKKQELYELTEWANDAGLDIYPVNIDNQFLIGRKSLVREKSESTFSIVTIQKSKLKLGDDNLTYALLASLEDDIKAFAEQYAIDREPYWPNDYLAQTPEQAQSNSVDKEYVMPTTSLNQILYGPPGTGKTYHTVEAAVKAAEPKFEWQNRDELKAEYDRLVNEKRIRFVTFHQSYGYEEFVEGLKAETINGQINYKVKPGVFKKSVTSAKAKHVTKVESLSRYNLDKRKIWKMSLGNTLTDEGEMVFNDCIDNNYVLLGYGEDINFKGCDSSSKIKQKFIDEGYELKPQDYNVTSVNTLVNKMSIGDLVIVSDGNYKFKAIAEITSDYAFLTDERDWYYQKRDVRWLMVFDESRPVEELFTSSLSQMTLYHLKDSVISREKLTALLNESKQELEEVKNHVLIIDEINRGNISKIFGELITLIEPSKRFGQAESIEVTLPYSGDPFSVPSNLHIIGTMNTADRSLALMDTALRRRFDFVEMMPNYDVLSEYGELNIEGVQVNLAELLQTMNQRIEVLYDREHMLGHAFFIPVAELIKAGDHPSALTELKNVFKNKVLPLLQEYFFEDWNRIRLVLGDNKKSKTDRLVKISEKSFNDIFGSGHGLGNFDTAPKTYQVVSFAGEDSIWNKAETYRGIYSVIKKTGIADETNMLENTLENSADQNG
ncbi:MULTISPECIES: AAA family ATPase [unclassified Shewanella]|uniref:AAA family ATPase n=1 Tax=unclassified Shewanella TaxID=196818 RepID=UPI0035520DEC